MFKYNIFVLWFGADADPSRALPANPSSSTQLRSRVIVTYHQNVDENNEEVQQLLEAEVGSVEECIRAIEVYGTADVAFNHIMELKEKGAIFQDSHLPIMPFVQENASAGAPQPGMTGFVANYFPVYNYVYAILPRTQDIIISVKNIGEQYLKLDELGLVLHQLSLNFPGILTILSSVYFLFDVFASPASVERERKITDLKRGQPHLLVVPPDQVLRAALSLYMEDSSLPLPTPEEMLICNQNTTSEEVTYSNYFLLYSSLRMYGVVIFFDQCMYVCLWVNFTAHKS